MYAWVIRSGGYFGSGTTGVDRSAPASNRSFWIWRRTGAIRSGTSADASATPSAAFVSSQSAYATSLGSFFNTREKSVPLVDLGEAVHADIHSGDANPDGIHWGWNGHSEVAAAVAEAVRMVHRDARVAAENIR